MLRLALASRAWTEDGISVRSIRGVSGHNGEQWSAIAGGLGRLLELGDTASAGRGAGRHRSGDRSRAGGISTKWPRNATPNSICCAFP